MKTLVESCFRLDTKLLKKDLAKARNKESVEGFLNFLDNGKQTALDYSIEYSFDENTYLIINYGEESQRILLSNYELTFGTRTYLTCNCGCRTNALYLKNEIFACRKCQRLTYESTTINRNSKHGKFFYKQSRAIKLIDMRESMGRRVFYKSHYSKRYLHYLHLCAHAGLMDEIIKANELKTVIDGR